MAPIRKPIPVKMICGVTLASSIWTEEVIQALEMRFSPVESRSPVFDFSGYTSYYEEEMGTGLTKLFISFQGLYDPGSLATGKVITTEIEMMRSRRGKREVNLDPGYITAAKLVLATTKDFAHRVYVGQGIYGDVQYRYRQGKFEPSKWTYPDYQSGLALNFFYEVRETFMKQEKTDDGIIRL